MPEDHQQETIEEVRAARAHSVDHAEQAEEEETAVLIGASRTRLASSKTPLKRWGTGM